MKHLVLVFFGLLIHGSLSAQNLFSNCSVTGSTTIYDYKNKKWFFTDSLDANKSTLPASTFKIVNSLIALETKAISDENETFKWDHADKKFFGKSMPLWNKDTNLKYAYKNSTIWFYVELAKKIGKKKYIKYLSQINYGNNSISPVLTDFWNYGNFGISPKNQIEFLIKLYENNLPFNIKNMEKVKEIMISDKSDLGTFRGKTGWTRKNGEDIGWYVGYLETNRNVYFFATRLTEKVYPENKDFAKCRVSITKQLLSKVIDKD